ncbi:hypothetical protein GB937_002249 [Aspergillus fischeri]|nr:hypothetical protein GB937_002249 [Aspergillus fischeri]
MAASVRGSSEWPDLCVCETGQVQLHDAVDIALGLRDHTIVASVDGHFRCFATVVTDGARSRLMPCADYRAAKGTARSITVGAAR